MKSTKLSEGRSRKVGEKHRACRCAGGANRETRQDHAEARWRSSMPKGLSAAHPFHAQGYDFDVPLLPGDHVTADTGTGFVHTAPGHGEEDFELMTST